MMKHTRRQTAASTAGISTKAELTLTKLEVNIFYYVKLMS